MSTFELGDERAAVIATLKEKLHGDPFPHATRHELLLRSALAKFDLSSVPKLLPPRASLPQAPARAAAARGGSHALRCGHPR